MNAKILPVLLAVSTLIGNADGREGRKAINSPEGLTYLSLSQIIAAVLEHNPMIQSARAKWLAARQRIPIPMEGEASYDEVLEGLSEGEHVVSSGNFLIDAESRIQGALKTWDVESEPKEKSPASPSQSPKAPLGQSAVPAFQPCALVNTLKTCRRVVSNHGKWS